MEEDAKAYDELNQPQIKMGCKFILELNISQGSRVLDMGCGTGDVTKFITDIVGSDGQVIGIDPDEARIKIAKEKYKEISNLQFHVGSSMTGFPHDNEPYFDVHISTHAFHWVPDDEKNTYIRKAHQCLKSGGKLAILCGYKASDREDQDNLGKYYALTSDGNRQLFHEIGLFPNVVIEEVLHLLKFESFEQFKRWAKASTHLDFDAFDPEHLKSVLQGFVTIGDDGNVTSKCPCVTIKASKNMAE